MPSRFDELTHKEALKRIAALQSDMLKVFLAFYTNDHWQGGAGWSGPMPDSTDTNFAKVLAEIAKAFVSKNAVKEVVNRAVNGVIGREPAWGFTVRRALAEGDTPTADEQALIDEAEAALTEWWDKRDLHITLQQALATSFLAGHGPLRLFVPPDEVRDDGTIEERPDLALAFDLLWIHNPAATEATTTTDRRSMQKAGLYAYKEGKDTFVELSYLDEGATVIKVLKPGTGEVTGMSLQLGGRLLLIELDVPALMTEQIVQNQKLINLALTMMSRNVVQGGFLERLILNAEMPGTYEDDPDNPGSQRFVAKPFKLGAGTTNFLTGPAILDEDGNTSGYATPSVVYRDPVSVKTFTETRDAAYRTILEEAHQLHYLIAGDAAPSGEARKQAMADYLADLLLAAGRINVVVRTLLEAALTMAATLSGQPDRFASLRATCAARINPGPLSSEDIKAIIEMVKEKLLSRETGMSRLDVDDVDAELARIAVEAEASELRQRRTLAGAVLKARREFDSGAASDGNEQPEGDSDDNPVE